MGYACPVCDDPQADAVHLANHVAFTALARGGDHEDWLDDRVPEWGQLGDEALAGRLVEHADEREYPQVFEDTTDDGAEGSHDHGTGGTAPDAIPDSTLEAARDQATGEGDGDAEDILAEARELTRKRHTDSETE